MACRTRRRCGVVRRVRHHVSANALVCGYAFRTLGSAASAVAQPELGSSRYAFCGRSFRTPQLVAVQSLGSFCLSSCDVEARVPQWVAGYLWALGLACRFASRLRFAEFQFHDTTKCNGFSKTVAPLPFVYRALLCNTLLRERCCRSARLSAATACCINPLQFVAVAFFMSRNRPRFRSRERSACL
jgi:hypothetical protein